MPGVLELLPAEQVAFQAMIDTIREVYERFGFLPIETPVMELAEVLLTKTGGETERQVYLARSTGAAEQGQEADLALRFDLTVPLARYVAEHQHDLAFPFRRYQIQRVYRGESPQRGRFREFYQCDIDVIGRDSLSVRYDAEMPAVIDQVFDKLDIGSFTIRLNNRKLMRGLLADAGVAPAGQQTLVLREIDKLDRKPRAAVAESMAGLGMTPAQVAAVLDTVSIRAEGGEALAALAEIRGGEETTLGAGELATVVGAMSDLGVPPDRYAVDLSIARGLDYYTGTVYETVLDAHPELGSICSGGRYDDLAGMFTSTRLPGVGISIGLTRLFWQLRERGMIDAAASTVEAYVTVMDDDSIGYVLGVAQSLRSSGINTETAVEASKLGRQLKYADRAGIRFALVAGSDERARGTVTVRDLEQKTQDEVAVADAAAHIRGKQG
jgi:histidyl-tRNA synthetase